MNVEATVTQWHREEPVTTSEILSMLKRESLSAYEWSNGPGEFYTEHSHSYAKVIYVVRGSITFHLRPTGTDLTLSEGDRLDLPPGVSHSATMGPEGVTCLEAHR